MFVLYLAIYVIMFEEMPTIYVGSTEAKLINLPIILLLFRIRVSKNHAYHTTGCGSLKHYVQQIIRERPVMTWNRNLLGNGNAKPKIEH